MFLSIVIPAYNVEKTLSRAVDSVIVQIHNDCEIIIVNDGSTDNTAKVADNYKNIKNVRILTTENRGLSAARNLGVKSAKGEYVAFLDSDDEFLPGLIQLAYEWKGKKDFDVLLFNHEKVYPDRTIKCDSINLTTNDSEKILEIIMKKNGLGLFACNKIWKKSLFNDVSFPVGILYEDIVTVYNLIKKSKLFVVTDFIGLSYYLNPNGITQSLFNKRHLDLVYQSEIVTKDVMVNYPSLTKLYVSHLFNGIVAISNKISVNIKKENSIYIKELSIIEKKYHAYIRYNNYIPRFKKLAWYLFSINPKLYGKIYLKYLDKGY